MTLSDTSKSLILHDLKRSVAADIFSTASIARGIHSFTGLARVFPTSCLARVHLLTRLKDGTGRYLDGGNY